MEVYQYHDCFISAPKIHLLGRLDLYEILVPKKPAPWEDTGDELGAENTSNISSKSKKSNKNEHTVESTQNRPKSPISKDDRKKHTKNDNKRKDPAQNSPNRGAQKFHEIYPVEIKTGNLKAKQNNYHHYIQLTAQALLLEHKFNTAVTTGKIIYVDELQNNKVQVEWVDLTVDMKRTALEAVQAIGNCWRNELIPKRTSHPQKCQNCEYWKLCKSA